MIWFWIGMAIFAIGFIMRLVVRFRWYKDFTNNAHTDLQKQEMRTKYRPLTNIGLGIEIIGLVCSMISIWS